MQRQRKITEWKKHPSVKKCYRKLFQKITLGEPDMFMTRIIDKVWQEKKNVAKVKIAYVISICENMLNPNNHYIQAVLVFGRDMSLDGTVWDSPRPWTRRCNVLGHLGHIYNIYIYSNLIEKLKINKN